MSDLTPEQEYALTQFKESLHLPRNGFHAMIIELCKEYQLPFQAVRTVVMNSQADIENTIRSDFEHVNYDQFTKAHWIAVIRDQLSEMAGNNKPLMEKLIASDRYLRVKDKLSKADSSETGREQIRALLDDIYEYEICNPLKAMLRTSSLFWAVKSNLAEMTQEQRQKFSDYPEYMAATEHLLKLID